MFRALICLLLTGALFATSALGANTHVDWMPFAETLKLAVDDQGFVDYIEVKKRRPAMDALAEELAKPGDFDGWSKDEIMAFLVNAYNFHILREVAIRYPIDSVKDDEDFFEAKQYPIMGTTYSFNGIEKLIKERTRDPRSHFIINCASVGCPGLRKEPYVAGRLDEQIQEQMDRFVQEPRHIQFDPEGPTLKVNKFFNWYGIEFLGEVRSQLKDFRHLKGKKAAALIYMLPYLTPHYPEEKLKSEDLSVEFMEYDWDLNDARRR